MDYMLATIMGWGGTFAPVGFHYCNGQSLQVNQNQALYSIIGNQFGGNSTAFNLPNFIGRFPIGAGNTGSWGNFITGQSGGTANTSLTVANLPPHNHTANVTGGTVSVSVAASQTQATQPQPTAGAFLAQGYEGSSLVSPVDIYVPSTDTGTKVALGGVSGSVAGLAVSIGNTGNGVPFTNIPPYQVIQYIICSSGLYPSRN